jgi:hypothetical protein
VLRAFAAGATTPRDAAAKARVKPTTAGVYTYRHRAKGLITGKSGKIRVTKKGHALLK